MARSEGIVGRWFRAFINLSAGPSCRAMYFVPVFVFWLWAVYATRRWKDWRTARYVTHLERRFWSPFRFFDNSQWPAEGLRLRRAYLRDMIVALFLFLATLSVVERIDRRSHATGRATEVDTNSVK